jgi:acyl-CoA synthetase (AMP-forming)/AMP-acid ligase II
MPASETTSALPATLTRGVPFRGSTLLDMLRTRAAGQPDDLAYTFLGDGENPVDELTWLLLDRSARAIAATLQGQLQSGDRALLIYPPGLSFIAGFFGCIYAGVLAVPVMPPHGNRASRGADRLAAIVADSDARCVLTSSDLRERLLDAVDPRMVRIITDGVPYEAAAAWREPEIDGETIAFLQYTSGSTAMPRGVMVSHGNLLHNLSMTFHLGGSGADTVAVSWLPVTHDMGLIEGILQPAFSGCPMYLMSPAAFLQRPVRWLRAISTYSATRTGGPNFAYDIAASRVAEADRQGLDLRTWRIAFNGAEPVRHDTMAAFSALYAPHGFRPDTFKPCYGLAESTLFVTGGHWTGASANDGADGSVSCGRPAEDMTVRIVDPVTRAVCGEGEPGEIQVAGPSVAHGYWNRPLESSRVFAVDKGRRWLTTGDLGSLQNGELHVTGRIKDLLIVRGVKHFPHDLERTAERRHRGVRTGGVAAVAVGSHVRGDRVALIAEIDPREVVAERREHLIRELRQAIAEEHGIQLYGVALVPPGTVPKTTSGKLQRFLCRDAWMNDTLGALASWRETAEPAGTERTQYA